MWCDFEICKNFDNFEKPNDFVWMVKPMAACKVLRNLD